MLSPSQTARGSLPRNPPRSARAHLLPLVVGSLVVLAIAGGWGWRELQAAPAVALPAEPDTLDPDVLSFLEGKGEATRSDPRSPETRADMGLAYMGNRLWNEARHEFEVAALLEPDEPLWRLHSAICIYNEGEMEASLETYEALETELPASPALLWRLGERLFDANRTDEALERFERLIEIAPMLPEGYLGRGKILNQRGEYARAVEDLERAGGLGPEGGPAQVARHDRVEDLRAREVLDADHHEGEAQGDGEQASEEVPAAVSGVRAALLHGPDSPRLPVPLARRGLFECGRRGEPLGVRLLCASGAPRLQSSLISK